MLVVISLGFLIGLLVGVDVEETDCSVEVASEVEDDEEVSVDGNVVLSVSVDVSVGSHVVVDVVVVR